MSIADPSALRESIRTTLAERSRNVPEMAATSEATAKTWRLIEAQLVPVIGAHGLDVLFRHALHQTAIAFPWLEAAVDRGGSASPLPSLMACLAAKGGVAAAEAVQALLFTFTELLAGLVGESLTERLLATVWVWAPPPVPSEQETSL
jgi:hypothetical protein